jgi:hypothetical protein
MISSQLSQLESCVESGDPTSSLEESRSRNIDDVSKEAQFVDLGIEVAIQICSRVPMMKAATAKQIISTFFDRFGYQAVLLLTCIECGAIGGQAQGVISPFLSLPLLREALASLLPLEEGSFTVDWKGMLEEERIKNQKQSEWISELEADTKKPSPPPRPLHLNEDPLDAASNGDFDSAVFLIEINPALIEAKNSNH